MAHSQDLALPELPSELWPSLTYIASQYWCAWQEAGHTHAVLVGMARGWPHPRNTGVHGKRLATPTQYWCAWQEAGHTHAILVCMAGKRLATPTQYWCAWQEAGHTHAILVCMARGWPHPRNTGVRGKRLAHETAVTWRLVLRNDRLIARTYPDTV